MKRMNAPPGPLLALPPSPPLRAGEGGQEAAPKTPALIELCDVGKVYASRRGDAAVTALDSVNLVVPRGAIVGVIGRSGAGKSTLIRLVNGLEKPSSGRVIIDGTEISELAEKDLRRIRRSIGMVFQHFNLLSSRTAFSNIALPLEIAGRSRGDIKARVESLLELVGLADKRDRYPAELSGGQKQRIGIARALATEPKVLLSDEATSALDPETTLSVLDLLATINAEFGLTILLITHEMAVIRRIAHEVAVLDHGRVVERGDVFRIFSRPQHPATQSFLASETGRSLPRFITARLQAAPAPAGGQVILRIVFQGAGAEAPVLSQLTRKFGFDVNILAGSADEVAGRPFATLVIGLPAHGSLDLVRNFLAGNGLESEVLGYVA
jgi:D-methionine transport system ATP-binding protein